MSELTQRRRMLVLGICCLSLLIVGMDNTIVNVALPSIRSDFGASVSGLQWTIDAYTLVLASLLVLAGSTADRLGRRRVFQAGLTLFTFGSLLCSLAPSLGWLITFRMIQALGGCMLNPVAMSIITNVFTEPKERARAIGAWAAVSGISIGLGPVVGGALTETVGWRAIFWVNIPIGIVAFTMAARFVPESKAARARRIDPIGQLLVIVILAAVTYAIIESPHLGWGSTTIVGLMVLAVLAVAGLIGYERRRVDPLIDLRFFRSLPFSGATVIAICAYAAFSGFLFLNTLYLQDARDLSPLRAGLLLLPMAATNIICAPLSGRLVGTIGTRVPLLLAGIGITVAAALLIPLSTHTSYPYLLISYAIFGCGLGLVNAPVTNTAVGGMPRAQAGVAAAIASTSRQVGVSLGVAIVGSVINSGGGTPTGAVFIDVAKPAWWILTGAGLGVLALGLLTTTGWARRTAARAASLLEEESAPATASLAGGR